MKQNCVEKLNEHRQPPERKPPSPASRDTRNPVLRSTRTALSAKDLAVSSAVAWSSLPAESRYSLRHRLPVT